MFTSTHTILTMLAIHILSLPTDLTTEHITSSVLVAGTSTGNNTDSIGLNLDQKERRNPILSSEYQNNSMLRIQWPAHHLQSRAAHI